MNRPTIINPTALEQLYGAWEQPSHHRVRADKAGEAAKIVQGRRPSPIVIAQNIRHQVDQWRASDYSGVSPTTRELLLHWFGRTHRVKDGSGNDMEFQYYFCQREAIETLIYLVENRGLTTLAEITAEFGGADRATAALGIDPQEDRWAKYAFKVATGAGKTKIMSLAVVWSYFHNLRESNSPMTRHFVMIAPNLTVFERLKADFGDGRIFDIDPLIPPAWRGDWNLSVVLQDEIGGAEIGGTLYLTNIHRLYDFAKRRAKADADTYSWVGPAVSKAKALDVSAALRDRITGHNRVMVLNDEAHHVWDPDSAWNEAIAYLNDTIRKRTGGGLVGQLDFSATPKDNRGNPFKHIVCDAPLGEAVDAGIVKAPIIGKGDKLVERTDENAAYRYEHHLTLGYNRWLASVAEWRESGKKPLLFVMTEDTKAADEIANRLNGDPLYKELNGKTINLHTNLKGKLKKRGKGEAVYYEFVENEKEISDEDLKQLRKLSRELDDNTSGYQCIVSVLMLREGWDVRNVTTIVPLRPYSSKANILPEQTLGRGLRRMTPPGQAAEVVTVVEHSAFAGLYRDELAQEGLAVEVVDVDDVPRTTVTIFADTHKDLVSLDLDIPQLSAGFAVASKLENLCFEDVQDYFSAKGFEPLPLGAATSEDIKYEGRHLFTNELIEQMNVKLPLLDSGYGAISFFREELEKAAGLKGSHAVLAPLLQGFLEGVLFQQKTDLFDSRLVSRLADADVRAHVRAVFLPLIRERIVREEKIRPRQPAKSVCAWRPFQVTASERNPVLSATKTPFNLVTCHRQLEVAMTHFADRAPDVAAFCKNAGPQALRIDYLSPGGRPASYTPDFIVRKVDGDYLLVETKGRTDQDVPTKARAAIAWCKAASTKQVKWDYLFVPQKAFSDLTGNQMEMLAHRCKPDLIELLGESQKDQLSLPFAHPAEESAISLFIDPSVFQNLPSRYKNAVEQAIQLFEFLEKKRSVSFGPVFQPLLGPIDEAAKGLILDSLLSSLPSSRDEQRDFFEPYFAGLDNREIKKLQDNGKLLKRMLVYQSGIFPLGVLTFCLEYAGQSDYHVGGVFEAIKEHFSGFDEDFLDMVMAIKDFRNTYIAHQEASLEDVKQAKINLGYWIDGLAKIYTFHRGRSGGPTPAPHPLTKQ